MGHCLTKPADDAAVNGEAVTAAVEPTDVPPTAGALSRKRNPSRRSASRAVGRVRSRSRMPASPLHADEIALAAQHRFAGSVVGQSRILPDRAGDVARKPSPFPPRAASDAESGGDGNGLPVAPSVLYAAMKEAIQTANLQWATSSPEVAALLADDIVYTDMRGEVAEGKAAALEAMDAGVERLLQRISRSTRSGKQGLKTDHLRLKAAPCKRIANDVWLQIWEFKLYLMNVRIQEEYTLDGEQRIVQLKRSMAGAKELVVAKG